MITHPPLLLPIPSDSRFKIRVTNISHRPLPRCSLVLVARLRDHLIIIMDTLGNSSRLAGGMPGLANDRIAPKVLIITMVSFWFDTNHL